jgi:enoyl-CoA hydratase/carnithine racemase
VGYISLNRPKALNTINLDMVRAIHQALLSWSRDDAVKAVVIQGEGEKAFCAGGDVRRVYDCIKEGSPEYEIFFKEEFELDEYIYHYPKPTLALMHGIVMGGGMGLTQGAQFRVICENTKIAMPETAIGYFPDVGASYFLTRQDPAMAAYLGVTGHLLSPSDSLFVGLASCMLEHAQWDALRKGLEHVCATHPTSNSEGLRAQIEELLNRLGAQWQASSALSQHEAMIREVFSSDSLGEVYDKLHAAASSPFAQQTLESMKKNAPLAMAATLRLLQLGATLSLSQAFQVELELNYAWKTKGEFVEGVRAALVDKDKKPNWKYALTDINSALLEQSFPVLYR